MLGNVSKLLEVHNLVLPISQPQPWQVLLRSQTRPDTKVGHTFLTRIQYATLAHVVWGAFLITIMAISLFQHHQYLHMVGLRLDLEGGLRLFEHEGTAARKPLPCAARH
jgi:hypothetical protein